MTHQESFQRLRHIGLSQRVPRHLAVRQHGASERLHPYLCIHMLLNIGLIGNWLWEISFLSQVDIFFFRVRNGKICLSVVSHAH